MALFLIKNNEKNKGIDKAFVALRTNTLSVIDANKFMASKAHITKIKTLFVIDLGL